MFWERCDSVRYSGYLYWLHRTGSLLLHQDLRRCAPTVLCNKFLDQLASCFQQDVHHPIRSLRQLSYLLSCHYLRLQRRFLSFAMPSWFRKIFFLQNGHRSAYSEKNFCTGRCLSILPMHRAADSPDEPVLNEPVVFLLHPRLFFQNEDWIHLLLFGIWIPRSHRREHLKSPGWIHFRIRPDGIHLLDRKSTRL